MTIPQTLPVRHPARSDVARRDLTSWVRRASAIFLRGFVGLLPLIVTIAVLGWVGYLVERALGTAILSVIPETWYVGGMGLAAGILVIFVFGLLLALQRVARAVEVTECTIARVPLVKTMYGGVRDLLSFFSRSEREGSASQVVVVSFGECGFKAVGLLMRDTFSDLPEGLADEGDVVVYFPQSYQLGGMLLLVARENVRPLDMNLEDALRFIVTAGAKSKASLVCGSDTAS